MKKFARGFLGRAFFVTVTDVALKGSTAILALILARFLGPSDFGFFAAAVASAELIMISGCIGFEQEMVRRSATSPLGEGLSLTQGWVAVTVSLTLVALGIYEGFFHRAAVPLSLLMLAVMVNVVNRFQLPYRYAGIILGEPQMGAMIHSVATATLLGLTLLVIWLARSAAAVLTAQIAVAVATVGAWEIWRRRRHLEFQPPAGGLPEARRFFVRALSFAVTNILWVGFFNVQIVMLTHLGTPADVGIYSAVFRMVAMTFILGFAITSAYSPSLFAAAHRDPASYGKLGGRMMLTLLGAGALGGLTVGFLARFLIGLLMGREFEAGVGPAHILAGAGCLRALNFGFSELLTTGGRHRWRIGLESLLLAVNMSLNLLWIPDHGPMGAARAVFFAELTMSLTGVVLWRAMRRRMKEALVDDPGTPAMPDAPGAGYDK